MSKSTNSLKLATVTYFVETCRHQPRGTVKIATADTDLYSWKNRELARKAMNEQFGVARTCVLCGQPSLDVHSESFEQRYVCSGMAQQECDSLHNRRMPRGASNPDTCVFQVVSCIGDVLGYVSVLKKGNRRKTAERAYLNMQRRFGAPRRCGQCDDQSHDLQQVQGRDCL